MDEKRNSGIYFKISEKDRGHIQKKMELAGIRNMSAYIRKMCIDGYVIRLDIPLFNEVAKLLWVTANNVNQISKSVNSDSDAYREDVAEIKGQFEEIRVGFGEILRQLAALEL